MSLNKYTLKLEWKPFKIFLPAFHTWVKSLAGSNYTGATTDDNFIYLGFAEEPTQQALDSIVSYWNSMTESAEQVRIAHSQKLDRAEIAARESIAYQNWDQMLPSERLIAMGRQISDANREELLTKYPQV